MLVLKGFLSFGVFHRVLKYSRVVLTPRRWCQVGGNEFPLATVARKPGHRGDHVISRKPLRGEGRMIPVEPVVLPPCFFLHGTHGCNRHPVFPAPSLFKEGGTSRPNLARIPAARMRRRASCLSTSLRGAERRSNLFFLCAATWIASRSLSSGAHSRDPLARNDVEGCRSRLCHTTTLSRFAARVMPV